jgi:membrane-associated phospholipid phosphatase
LKSFVWLGATAGVFLALLVVVLFHPGPVPADAGILHGIQSAFGVVSDPASSITQLVLLFAPPIAALLYVAYVRRWRVALWFAAAVVSSILVSGTLQTVLGRPGPPPRTILEPQTTGSFPSVSAEEVVLQGALIAYLGSHFLPNRRYLILGFAVVSVGLICFVLIDTAVHWPSDVLGGLSFGGAWAAIAVILMKRRSWLRGSLEDSSLHGA